MNDRLQAIKRKYIDDGAEFKNPDIEWLVRELESVPSNRGLAIQRLRQLVHDRDSTVALNASIKLLECPPLVRGER